MSKRPSALPSIRVNNVFGFTGWNKGFFYGIDAICLTACQMLQKKRSPLACRFGQYEGRSRSKLLNGLAMVNTVEGYVEGYMDTKKGAIAPFRVLRLGYYIKPI